MKSLDRRALLRLSGLASALGLAWTARRTSAHAQEQSGGAYGTMEHAAHRAGPVGRTSLDAFNPSVFLRAWNFSDRAASERGRYYRETPRPDGTLLREYDLVAVDREIEIAHHAPDDGELLEIFLAKNGRLRPQEMKQLRHHRCDSTKMARS